MSDKQTKSAFEELEGGKSCKNRENYKKQRNVVTKTIESVRKKLSDALIFLGANKQKQLFSVISNNLQQKKKASHVTLFQMF